MSLHNCQNRLSKLQISFLDGEQASVRLHFVGKDKLNVSLGRDKEVLPYSFPREKIIKIMCFPLEPYSQQLQSQVCNIRIRLKGRPDPGRG